MVVQSKENNDSLQTECTSGGGVWRTDGKYTYEFTDYGRYNMLFLVARAVSVTMAVNKYYIGHAPRNRFDWRALVYNIIYIITY